MLGLIAAILIAFLSIFVPGVLFAFALLRKTELHTFEIVVIGVIFGLIATPTLTWLESYLMDYVHFFSFSLQLSLINVLVLTLIGAILCWREGLFKDFGKFITTFGRKVEKAETEIGAAALGMPEPEPAKHHAFMNVPMWIVWTILLALMLITFATRMLSIGTAPKFFEFDPYFDMVDTQYVLTYGRQLLLDPSAWPSVPMGTNHRIEPIVPYLEAYWYSLVNSLEYHNTQLSTSLLSYVGGVYPPITAALLVFVIFSLLYHEYDTNIGIMGAALTTMMPVLLTTFIAGEQLVEPWGIFTLFFFFAAYMLAIRNMKDKRLALLAGIAFASTFLGAHYYTVDTGVLVIYILLQGLLDVLRGTMDKDFYKMNAIVIGVIAVFLVLFVPYESTLQNRVPFVFGIPITIAGPIAALLIVAVLDYGPKLLKSRNIIFKELNFRTYATWLALMVFVLAIAAILTPLGKPVRDYLTLSARFTTPSKPLFMTVQEFIPTGFTYNFGAQGFGPIGANILGIPMLVWAVCGVALVLLVISILYRRSKTGILYMAIAIPLMFAGFSEVKYLPHFGVAYIMLFGIILGELLYLGESHFKLVVKSKEEANKTSHLSHNVYREHPLLVNSLIIISLFFLFGFYFVVAAAIYLLARRYAYENKAVKHDTALIALCIALAIFSFSSGLFNLGESGSLVYSFEAAYVNFVNPSNACNLLSNSNNQIGYNIYCNTIPQYWLNSMSWIKTNVGPFGPRVLSWWDYGDWINWFGNSNAYLRGDNANATEDYAVAAHLVLGPKYNYTPKALAAVMNGNQSKYLLLDQDLVAKWQALNFLGCTHINATGLNYAISQGKAQNPPVPYLLGSSPCEIAHDPQFALVPLSALLPSNQTQQSLGAYCSISSSKVTYIKSLLVIGTTISNNTICINATPNYYGVWQVFNVSGTKLNAVVQSQYYLGAVNVYGSTYVEFLVIYLPNAPNDTITNAPSEFYNSNFYKGFFFGRLPGFVQVYPQQNATGINFVNGSYPVRILALRNFTGTLPPVPPKPSWIHNNYTIP